MSVVPRRRGPNHPETYWKITDVIAHQPTVAVNEPFTSARGQYYKSKGALVVEVVTDEGIVGWGDCYGPAAVSRSVIESLYKPALIGQDLFNVEVMEMLYNKVKDYGLSGMTISALSGVDIALWDIIAGRPPRSACAAARACPPTAFCAGLSPSS